MGFAGPVAVGCVCPGQPSARLRAAEGQVSCIGTIAAADSSPSLHQVQTRGLEQTQRRKHPALSAKCAWGSKEHQSQEILEQFLESFSKLKLSHSSAVPKQL